MEGEGGGCTVKITAQYGVSRGTCGLQDGVWIGGGANGQVNGQQHQRNPDAAERGLHRRNGSDRIFENRGLRIFFPVSVHQRCGRFMERCRDPDFPSPGAAADRIGEPVGGEHQGIGVGLFFGEIRQQFDGFLDGHDAPFPM